MSRKKILITNDDGVFAEGINVLAEKLSSVCDVYIFAPDSNRSAVSNFFSMNRPLQIRKISENKYSCSGSPVDCVIAATRSKLFGVEFDAVISGINRGPNLGTDIIYSGTAAAARQAVLYGLPGVALSLDSSDETNFNFSSLAEFVAKNLDEIISLSSSELFVSLNASSSDNYREVVFASLCERNYNDSVPIFDAPDGCSYGFICGGELVSEGEDFDAVQDGKIVISLIEARPRSLEFKGKIDFKF